jgi:hypothetical protein
MHAFACNESSDRHCHALQVNFVPFVKDIAEGGVTEVAVTGQNGSSRFFGKSNFFSSVASPATISSLPFLRHVSNTS